ncbi:alpha-L-fucosidase [Flavitalea antarctica]
MKHRLLFLLSCVLWNISLIAQQKYSASWESIDSRPIPKWFTDAKFGIFIHWGLYSVPAWAPVDPKLNVGAKYSEWYWWRIDGDKSPVGDAFRNFHKAKYGDKFRYQDFAGSFKAELFKPEQWAELFVKAGAKYVVLTSKHHEGFALWPSKESWNWNAVDVGPHRDLAADLTKAVKGQGLKMGFYYSLYEWFNPLYKTNVNRYVDEHMMPQMKDLVMSYKPDIFWTDGEWEHLSATWKSTEFLSWLYNESPVRSDVVVNDRWGKETRSKHGGFYTTEYDLIHDANSKEIKIAHPWEECRGIGSSFGYNRNENLSEYESSESLVHMLIEKVARGGNLLLDIGPDADGTIPVIMQQRLLDLGNWLTTNGEAIYGTTSWNAAPVVKKETKVFFTKKGKDLYVLLTELPTGVINIQNIKKPTAISMVGMNANVGSSYSGNNLKITSLNWRPGEDRSKYAWVIKLENAVQ